MSLSRIFFDRAIPQDVLHTHPRGPSVHNLPSGTSRILIWYLGCSHKWWEYHWPTRWNHEIPWANSFPMTTMIFNGSQIGGKCELWKRFLPMTFNIVTWILGDVLGIITSRVRWMRLRKRTSLVTFAIHLLRLLLGGGFNKHIFLKKKSPLKKKLGEDSPKIWGRQQFFPGMGWLKRNQPTTLRALRARWGLQDLVASSGASDSFEVGWLVG